jgi:hypothetical protein
MLVPHINFEQLYLIFNNICKYYNILYLIKFRIITKLYRDVIDSILINRYKELPFHKIILSLKKENSIYQKIVNKYLLLNESNYNIFGLAEYYYYILNQYPEEKPDSIIELINKFDSIIENIYLNLGEHEFKFTNFEKYIFKDSFERIIKKYDKLNKLLYILSVKLFELYKTHYKRGFVFEDMIELNDFHLLNLIIEDNLYIEHNNSVIEYTKMFSNYMHRDLLSFSVNSKYSYNIIIEKLFINIYLHLFPYIEYTNQKLINIKLIKINKEQIQNIFNSDTILELEFSKIPKNNLLK